MTDLSQYPSLCSPQALNIVSRDKRHPKIVHHAHNPERNLVRHYHVDGQIIQNAVDKKCDFLLINDTKENVYLIELKGKHLLDAIDQLKNTVRLLQIPLCGPHTYYRIIYRSNTFAIRGSEYERFRRLVGGRVLAHTDRIEETI